jgi:hypothetical protein
LGLLATPRLPRSGVCRGSRSGALEKRRSSELSPPPPLIEWPMTWLRFARSNCSSRLPHSVAPRQGAHSRSWRPGLALASSSPLPPPPPLPRSTVAGSAGRLQRVKRRHVPRCRAESQERCGTPGRPSLSTAQLAQRTASQSLMSFLSMLLAPCSRETQPLPTLGPRLAPGSDSHRTRRISAPMRTQLLPGAQLSVGVLVCRLALQAALHGASRRWHRSLSRAFVDKI